MKLTFTCWLPLLLALAMGASAQDLQQNIRVHDPVLIKQDSIYCLFATGRGIAVWSSSDMENWRREDPVFPEAPVWAVAAVPTFRNHVWAPDTSHHKGRYYLYYSVSAFGKNTSAIGLATNTTLNPADEDYKWEDHGKLIQSIPGKTNWNAIDPNMVTDELGTPWLSFGSFWGGLKLVKLRKDRMSIGGRTDNLPTIASRRKNDAAEAGANAIEAPFIFRKNGYYYLFASIDYCCKGKDSTYKMIVGRAKDIQGPYLDREGESMREGGGTLVLAGDQDWHGVGHNAGI
ncbi:family 43 glycosylhydrolase [Pontibacter russatus]|uniref:family 43 glycosylhydrolase n=1 Tax=Pontibacter russatus TaxID=2694929 RepID=UPI001EFF65E2|nr:family 43 glycosylhydrolase [Pontibacter russatus]